MFSKTYSPLSLSRATGSKICLLLACLTLNANAFKIDPSCKSLKGLDSEGVERNYGDASDLTTTASLEAMQFATLARYYLAQVAEGQGNPFDQYRTTQAFNVFQGTFGGETTPEDRLNKILGGKVNEEVEIGN